MNSFEKLNFTFSNSDVAKQDWLEVKIIKRLHQLDAKDIMTEHFYNTLLRCERARKNFIISDAKKGLKRSTQGYKLINILILFQVFSLN